MPSNGQSNGVLFYSGGQSNRDAVSPREQRNRDAVSSLEQSKRDRCLFLSNVSSLKSQEGSREGTISRS
jgi:hypothetical protein